MGRYIPPELEGLKSFNQASGKNATNRKADGTQVVRFECPFAIWCSHCEPEIIIGQGVRFNAEKRKVGEYFTTPIWSFKIKHTVCGGLLDIHTDPKNTEYVVVSGGRKRETGVGGRGDWIEDGNVELGARVKPQLDFETLAREGGFGQLEKIKTDKEVADKEKHRVEELRKRSERDWSDPYDMNKKIRRDFRIGRRQRQNDSKTGEALQERFGLGLDVVAPSKKDGQKAKMIDFKPTPAKNVSSTGLFTKSKIEESKAVIGLTIQDKSSAVRSMLVGNTRSRADPFLSTHQVYKQGVQSKSLAKDTDSISVSPIVTKTTTLVDYNSD